jgi:hypothetical protein
MTPKRLDPERHRRQVRGRNRAAYRATQRLVKAYASAFDSLLAEEIAVEKANDPETWKPLPGSLDHLSEEERAERKREQARASGRRTRAKLDADPVRKAEHLRKRRERQRELRAMRKKETEGDG